tara:strand:- start:45 stop:437 length:393 start_codon:yes stop_codon:yes gene_type:complete
MFVAACLALSGAAFAQVATDELSPAETEAIERVKASARKKLAEMGLLEDMPTVESAGGLESFARKAERHCGVKPGNTLRIEGGNLIFVPREDEFENNYDALSCLLAVITLSGTTKFGFIGNEQISEPEGQ